jgi:hypothetical protein
MLCHPINFGKDTKSKRGRILMPVNLKGKDKIKELTTKL